MRRLGVACVIVFGGVASADPAPPAAACLPPFGAYSARVVAGQPIVCGATDKQRACVTADGHAVPEPPRAATAELRGDATAGFTACSAGACKPVGPKLAAAIAAFRAQDPAREVGVLADLSVATLDGGANDVHVWTVPGDRELKLKAPKEYAAGDGAMLTRVQVAGDVLLASWTDCAGPCGKTVIVGPNGKNRGAWFDDADGIDIGHHQLAVATTIKPHLLVLDARHGTRIAKVALPNGDQEADVAEVAPGEFAIATSDTMEHVELVRAKLAHGALKLEGKPVELPMCAAPSE